ncbi:hypothetical protein EVAR_68530_1, partial [Eumeta japonica]
MRTRNHDTDLSALDTDACSAAPDSISADNGLIMHKQS